MEITREHDRTTAVLSETERLSAIRSCRYCPMCHSADLVTTLERRETYSARYRGLLLWALEEGKATWDSEVADVMYRFFADGLCGQVCAGHIPHDELVIDARRRLVDQGHAPPVVAEVRASIERTGNPWGQKEPDLFELARGALPLADVKPGVIGTKFRSEVVVYFGAAARIQRPSSVRALAAILQRADVTFSVLADESDPGFLLYQLGEVNAGVALAKALIEKLGKAGTRTVVTPDAEAYRTLKLGLGEVSPASGLVVLHASEFLLTLASGFRFRAPHARKVAYHDPCALARFAPCLEAPRTLLSAATGAAPLEIGSWSRDLVQCSGECGGVPFTHPELSQKAADRRIAAARQVGTEILVAGSPAAANALSNRGIEAQELVEFLAATLA